MDQLSRRTKKIEETLKNILSLQVDSPVFNEIRQEIFPTHEVLTRINAPVLELLNRGGKRWRALVLLLTHELCQGDLASVFELAAMVELFHTASLIVDDIEDKAEKRRGGPAIHLVHGVDMAINTANLLYFLPMNLIKTWPLSWKTQNKMMQHYIQAMTCLHYGQGFDIVWHNDHAYIPRVEEYLRMCRLKTGKLARLCAELGAISAGAGEKTIQTLGQIWEDIGVGFQLLDDVRNLTEDRLGKIKGDDIIEGKKSLPVIYHAQSSPDQGAGIIAILSHIANNRDADPQPMITKAIESMTTSGSLDQVLQTANELLESAWTALEKGFSSSVILPDVKELIASFWKKV